MSYVDQDMSGNKIVSALIVALIMVALGYGLIKGFEVVTGKKLIDTTEVIEIEEEIPEPEEEPPPEPERQVEPPPIVSPPPPIQLPAPTPPLQTQTEIPETFTPTPQADPVPEPAPEPTPPPRVSKRPNPEPRNNRGSWANTNDYPSRALREGREGTTRVRLTVGTNGRVSDCAVTGSSGHSDLDAATCKNVKRRARFRPALDPNDNEVTGTYNFAVRWQIPDR